MSRAKPLSCQTTKHFVVIRKNRAYPLEVIEKWLNDNYEKWAYIVHEKDEDPVTHVEIPIHYHYIGIANKNKTPLSTWLNQLAKHLKTNTDGIEFDGYVHFEKSLQYLIHKNNKEKTPHKFEDIKFSGWTKEEMLTYIACDDSSLNFDRVYNLCRREKNMIDVIRELGLHNFHKYRSTIWDIWELTKRQMAQEQLGVINDISYQPVKLKKEN